jgi:hypothetical protein
MRCVQQQTPQALSLTDAYADTTVFQMLSGRPLAGFTVRILCSKYGAALSAEGKRFAAQYGGIYIEIRPSRDFHDRFVIIDGETCVHIGASIKDAGKTACMISRVEDDVTRKALLNTLATAWAGATVI